MVEKPQGNSEPQSEQGEDNKPEYVSREELNQIVNSAISSRNKSFEKKFDEFINKFNSNTAEKQETKPTSEKEGFVKRIAALEQERDAAISKQRDKDLREQVRDNLTKAGIPPHLQKAAMAILISEDKVVSYDEDGTMVFKTQNEGNLVLAEGIKSWVKSDEGKNFLPAKGAAGSGDRNYNSSNNKTSQKLTDVGLAEKLLNLRHNG